MSVCSDEIPLYPLALTVALTRLLGALALPALPDPMPRTQMIPNIRVLYKCRSPFLGSSTLLVDPHASNMAFEVSSASQRRPTGHGPVRAWSEPLYLWPLAEYCFQRLCLAGVVYVSVRFWCLGRWWYT